MANGMRIPERDNNQFAQDAERTLSQVQQLGAPGTQNIAGEANPFPDPDEILRRRHAGADGALKFDIVNRTTTGQALVVSRQLIVPKSPGQVDADFELTNNRKFAKRSPGDFRCQRLHDDVWVYSFDTGEDEEASKEVDDALAFLSGNGVPAARTMVTALHMVVKSVDGPAPTSVTVDTFPQAGAPLTAEGEIVVAVIDTGIDEQMRGDGWLNEIARVNVDTNGIADNVVDKLDAIPQPNDLLDFGAGHGTFVAGIVRQVDPLARIIVYRALDSDGLASEEAVACAMLRAAEDHVHVISLSLGMQAVDDDDRRCPALTSAVQQIMAHENPPAIVASAGNYGTTELVYPAALPGVVSVAALRAEKDPGSGQPLEGAKWSTHGDWVTCSTIGEGIVSTFVKGREDPEFGGNDVYPLDEDGDSWAVWSGTSFAAPQIAAHIAKKCRERLTPQDAVAALFPGNAPALPGYGTPVVLLPGTRSP